MPQRLNVTIALGDVRYFAEMWDRKCPPLRRVSTVAQAARSPEGATRPFAVPHAVKNDCWWLYSGRPYITSLSPRAPRAVAPLWSWHNVVRRRLRGNGRSCAPRASHSPEESTRRTQDLWFSRGTDHHRRAVLPSTGRTRPLAAPAAVLSRLSRSGTIPNTGNGASCGGGQVRDLLSVAASTVVPRARSPLRAEQGRRPPGGRTAGLKHPAGVSSARPYKRWD